MHKSLLGILTLAALALPVFALFSYEHRFHLPVPLGGHRHICFEAVHGMLFFHYGSADREEVVGGLDEHETELPRHPGYWEYAYAERAATLADNRTATPKANFVPVTRFARSYRYGISEGHIGALCGLLLLYPSVVLIGLPLRRQYRRKRGLCIECAADLLGEDGDLCPSCAAPS